MNGGTEAFWLLTEPFDPDPDERFLIPTPPVRSLIAGLREALTRRPGWIVLVGAPGTGKSVLAKMLVESLRDHSPVAYVADSGVGGEELRNQIETQLAEDDAPATTESLLRAHRAGRRALVILDGTEHFSETTANELEAAFTARDDNGSAMLPIDLIVIVDASPEAALPEWMQRRGARVFALGNLSAEDTAEYVRRRIRLAAGGERDLFDAGALDEVHRRTHGRPDAINRLCGLALDRVANAGGSHVGSEDIREAAALLGDLVGEVQLALSIADGDAEARTLNGARRTSPPGIEATRAVAAPPRTPPADGVRESENPRVAPTPARARRETTPARGASGTWRIVVAAVAGAMVGALLTLWLAPVWTQPDAIRAPASLPSVGSDALPAEAVATDDATRGESTETSDRPPAEVVEAASMLIESEEVAADEPAVAELLSDAAANETGEDAVVVAIGSLPAVSSPPPTTGLAVSIAEPEPLEDEASAPPPRIALPLDQAGPILSRAFRQRAEPGTAWTLSLMDTQTGRPQPIERAQLAHGEFDGRIRTLASIEGDGDRRTARLLDEGRDGDGRSARVYWPEDRVIRSVGVDDPFAGTGFRYSDFRARRVTDFSLVSLVGDQRDGEPVFTVDAVRLGDDGPERIEFVIGERDGRLLEVREFERDREAPSRRLLMPRPQRSASGSGARVEEWRLLGPTGREIARAHLEIAQLAEDAGPELFTFSRLSDPEFRVPTR